MPGMFEFESNVFPVASASTSHHLRHQRGSFTAAADEDSSWEQLNSDCYDHNVYQQQSSDQTPRNNLIFRRTSDSSTLSLLSPTPSSVDTDILLGACDRLLDNIDRKLEPLTRVQESSSNSSNSNLLLTTSNKQQQSRNVNFQQQQQLTLSIPQLPLLINEEEEDQVGTLQSVNNASEQNPENNSKMDDQGSSGSESDCRNIEIEPPSLREDDDASPAEDCEPSSRYLQRQPPINSSNNKHHRLHNKQQAIKVLPLAAVPQGVRKAMKIRNGKAAVACGGSSNSVDKCNNNRHQSRPTRRRHTLSCCTTLPNRSDPTGIADVLSPARSPIGDFLDNNTRSYQHLNQQQIDEQQMEQQQQQMPNNVDANEYLENHVTYIPLEGNLPVCVYKVQHLESGSNSTLNGVVDEEIDDEEGQMTPQANNRKLSKSNTASSSASNRQRTGSSKLPKQVTESNLDEWERQQLERLKHNIEKMTTRYFAGVPLTSTFKDVQLDSDLETVQSSVVNEKFDAAFKAAKRAVNSPPPVVSAGEHCSDDEFIVTSKPPIRSSSSKQKQRFGSGRDSPPCNGLPGKSLSSKNINELSYHHANGKHSKQEMRYIEDIQALRDDIWQLSEQRTKTMGEVAELSDHLKNVLEELHSSQYQVDEYNVRMEEMRRDFDEAERKKEKLYQELMVLQTEIHAKAEAQKQQAVATLASMPNSEQPQQAPAEPAVKNEEQTKLEKLVEDQLARLLAKSNEVSLKERQVLEEKIAHLEAGVMKNQTAGDTTSVSSSSSRSRSSTKTPGSPARSKSSQCHSPKEEGTAAPSPSPVQEAKSAEPSSPTADDLLHQKMEAMQKEIKFMSAKLEESLLDKEAMAERRRQLEEKIRRLEGERDNLLELFLRNDRLPVEYAPQALDLARQIMVQQPAASQDPQAPPVEVPCARCQARLSSGTCDASVSPMPAAEEAQQTQQQTNAQNLNDVIGKLHEQVVEAIERKLAATAANEEALAAVREKEAEIEALHQSIRAIEEQHEKQVEQLVKTIETERKDRLKIEEVQEDLSHFERELADANKRNEQLSQQVHLLQAQIELDREQARLAIEEKTMLIDKVKEEKTRDLDRLRQQFDDEKQFDVTGLETQLAKLREELHNVESERQRDLDLFANGLVNFDHLETQFVNDINEECRKIAALMEVTPRRVKLMTFRIERAANPAAQFNTILSSSSSPIFSALSNLQSTCQELREMCLRQKTDLDEKKECVKKAEQEKADDIAQLRAKLQREKQEELATQKESFLKEHRSELDKLRVEARQVSAMQNELKQKDTELKEIEAHMTTWKEETIDKLTNKLTMKFVEEMEKAAKNQTKIVRELERRLGDRTREVERAQREIIFLRQLRNITDSTMAARCVYKDVPPPPVDICKKMDESPVTYPDEQPYSSPCVVKDLKESLMATAVDCVYADETAALKRRAVRLQQHSAVSNNSNISKLSSNSSNNSTSASSICIAGCYGNDDSASSSTTATPGNNSTTCTPKPISTAKISNNNSRLSNKPPNSHPASSTASSASSSKSSISRLSALVNSNHAVSEALAPNCCSNNLRQQNQAEREEDATTPNLKNGYSLALSAIKNAVALIGNAKAMANQQQQSKMTLLVGSNNNSNNNNNANNESASSCSSTLSNSIKSLQQQQQQQRQPHIMQILGTVAPCNVEADAAVGANNSRYSSAKSVSSVSLGNHINASFSSSSPTNKSSSSTVSTSSPSPSRLTKKGGAVIVERQALLV